MRNAVNADRLAGISARLGDTVIDPTIWPEVLDQISVATGSVGAGLLQSDVRSTDIPRSAGADEAFTSYFANGWHSRDVRAERGVPLLRRGEKVVTDQDIVTPEEMNKLGFYTENLAPSGLQWFAAIGFWSGSALWGLSIQRTAHEGPFDDNDKRALAGLSQRLTETATLSKAVGRAVLSGVTNALHLIKQPAIALDRLGFILDANGTVEEVLDEEIRIKDRRLYVRDQQAKSALDSLIDQWRTTTDTAAAPMNPILVQRRDKPPVVIRVLPVDGPARSPFLGARAVLVISDLCRRSGADTDLLAQAFGLSPAEAKLASVMVSGISPEQAGEELGIARETARNQLKAVFAKTATHRQGELIALLSRL
jgi:DNA-binding CsgD family transcriptional regulator